MSKATAPSLFRDLQQLYKTLLYVLVVAMLLSFLLVQFSVIKPVLDLPTDRMLQVVAVLYCFAAVFAGLQLFRRKLEQIRANEQSPREKLAQYRAASLLQWWLMESAAIFSTICYVLTGNWAFLALAFTLLVLFGGLNPFKQKVMIQLRLSDQDVAGI
ncbi:hypothetical protein [Flavihumibacter sp. CACIAM 22H1]|uniref:hypothetical protein n=1 Tax=Flavihumibacter sp. CACIAM 22H1 TaxID=1812911 RepID=UPI0007A85085|nr:hypothetical protein [Flavihumibacter sp. CACIAM 22H1]KYP13100.1 MAG: hypothetical protein A1D16_11860 [Flavihumibacter sp. CACIAM 22H1]